MAGRNPKKESNRWSNGFSVKLFPHNAPRPTEFQVKPWHIKLLSFSILLLVGALLFSGTYLYFSPDAEKENRRLKVANLELSARLQDMRNKIDRLDKTIERVQRFSDKLHVLTDIPGSGGSLAMGPLSPAEMVAAEGSYGLLNPAVASKLTEKFGGLDSLDVLDELNRVLGQAKDQEKELAEISSFLENNRLRLSSIPSIWPVKGWISSNFGYRLSPFTGERRFHEGLDISAPRLTPILAPAEGVVTYRGERGGYGKVLVVDHGFNISTRYAHLSEFFVQVGDRIKRGQKLGSVGNTGRSTGPHLHYEVRVHNIPQNPLRFILD